MNRVRAVLRLAGRERGYSLVELLISMLILSVILGALVTLFVRASNAEVDMNRRFQSQQTARVAVDRMRREIHCASAISPPGTSASIAVTLPAQCPSAGGVQTTVTYDVVGSGQRYQLRRNAVVLADYVTEQNAFSYTAPVAGVSRGKLRVTLPINITPWIAPKEWRLVGDMVLRNTSR
jgi:prepilin-type N-terminal cleavage/methylation domain-containing protein